jgi:hypothetical protein
MNRERGEKPRLKFLSMWSVNLLIDLAILGAFAVWLSRVVRSGYLATSRGELYAECAAYVVVIGAYLVFVRCPVCRAYTFTSDGSLFGFKSIFRPTSCPRCGVSWLRHTFWGRENRAMRAEWKSHA